MSNSFYGNDLLFSRIVLRCLWPPQNYLHVKILWIKLNVKILDLKIFDRNLKA